jgi:hypothetical protein
MYTIGIKTQFGTFNANTIYDADGKAICVVYGIASNLRLEKLDERDAEGLAIAKIIVDALNAKDAENAR